MYHMIYIGYHKVWGTETCISVNFQ